MTTASHIEIRSLPLAAFVFSQTSADGEVSIWLSRDEARHLAQFIVRLEIGVTPPAALEQ